MAALRIGDLDFGISADTKPLKAAIKELNKFASVTNRIAKQQKKDSQAEINARGRQESAIKKSFQATLKLQQELKKVGASNARIGSTTQAFKRLTREMSSGRLTTLQFTRAQDAFSARLGKSRRALDGLKKSALASKKGVGGLNVLIRDLESASVLAVGPLSGLGARIRAISAITSRSTITMAAWVIGITAGVVAVAKLAAAAVGANSKLETMHLRFQAATGSVQLANAEMAFVIKTAKSLGLNMDALGNSYAKFSASSKGTRLEGEKSRELFVNVARAAAALKLDASSLAGVFKALEQMMSKGSITSEELKQQLGDQMPGALRIMSLAVGVTTRELIKMMEAGELISGKFLPEFGRVLNREFGATAEKNLDTLSGAWNNLTTATTLWLKEFNKTPGVLISGLNPFGAVSLSFSDMAVGITKATTATVELLSPMDEYTKAAMEAAEATKIWANALQILQEFDEAQEVSKVYETISDSIRDVANEAKALDNTLLSLNSGTDPRKLLDMFTNVHDLVKAIPGDLKALAKDLESALGRDVAPTVFGVADAFAELQDQVRKSGDMLGDFVSRLDALPEGLSGVGKTLAALTTQIALLKAEPIEGGDIFKDITKPVIAFAEVVDKLAIAEAARNRLKAVFLSLLTEEVTLTKQAKQNEKDLKTADRDAERLAKAITRGMNATKRLRAETEALMDGTVGLKAYKQITEDLLRYEAQLRIVGKNEALITRLVEMRRDALMDLAAIQDNVNAAALQASTGIINSFEAIILKTKSVGDALRDLARELLRVFLRATFLDPLLEGLTGSFSSIFRGAGIGTQGGTSGAPDLSKGAHGLDFMIGGSGGGDNKLISFMAKSGERVMVTRPGAPGGGSGSITIQINAPGADAGTEARIKEMMRVELVPQIIQAATQNTLIRLQRPKFA